jgi:predicted GTPase
MPFGAGVIAAEKYGAATIVDPRPYATGTLKETYQAYPHLSHVIPAMGYSNAQVRDLERTLNAADCDLVIFATPIHLPRILSINKPTLRVMYQYQDHGEPTLEKILVDRLKAMNILPQG